MADHIHINGLWLCARALGGLFETVVNDGFDFTFETFVEVREESGATAEDDVGVETTTAIDGRLLDGCIDKNLEGSGVV